MAGITALVLVLGIAAYGVSANSYLSNLAEYVKSHSDPDVVPQQNVNSPVKVDFMFAVMNIYEADKEHNTFTTENFVSTGWNTSITWDPEDPRFGGANIITLPKKYFWTPVMQQVNTAVQVKDLSSGVVTVRANGLAGYSQIYRLTGLCDVSHVESGASCYGRSALWGYSKDQVNVTNIQGLPQGYIPYFAGSKYEITGFGMKFVDVTFDNKEYQFIDSTMSFRAKPRTGDAPVNLHFNWH